MGARAQERCIVVEKGNAESLLRAIEEANRTNADTAAPRLFVLIPDGTYHLGTHCLTTITGHNVALVGQSMDRTVIVNEPPIEEESINKTATMLNRGRNTYVQDLTLQNALDYYRTEGAGRAVVWQDKGNRAIFKRVRMLSYQDTYYSHSEQCQHYFEECDIHGTVDFICGAGDIYFNRCDIVTEKRDLKGLYRNVIVAARTSETKWGYVFDHCTIYSDMSPFHLARGWHTTPRCAWLYTRIEQPDLLLPERFDPLGMRTVDSEFYEYHSTDLKGNLISPASNIVTYELNEQRRSVETIMTDKQAKRYTLKNVFPDWRPEKTVNDLQKEIERLKRRYL